MLRYPILPLLFMISCVGCSNMTDGKEPEQIRVVKSVVATSSEMTEKSYAGLSTPEMEVNLAFKVAGQLLVIQAITGEKVAQGAVLAQLDPRDLELAVAADKSSYEQARSSYERAVRLLEHEAISKQEAESAESTFARAKSAYENSLDLLEQTSLQAPFNAVVERVYAQEYQRVQAGESIVRLVSPTTNQVSFTLPENSLSAIKNNETTFRVMFDNYPGELFDASIVEFARSSSDASGFPVILKIENPAPTRFYINSGLSCTILMSTPDRNIKDVIVPLSAIYAPTKGGAYVWVIGGDDQVELRSVVLGDPVGKSSVVILGGVNSGDRVVTAGVYQLHNNQKVKIIK